MVSPNESWLHSSWWRGARCHTLGHAGRRQGSRRSLLIPLDSIKPPHQVPPSPLDSIKPPHQFPPSVRCWLLHMGSVRASPPVTMTDYHRSCKGDAYMHRDRPPLAPMSSRGPLPPAHSQD